MILYFADSDEDMAYRTPSNKVTLSLGLLEYSKKKITNTVYCPLHTIKYPFSLMSYYV